jgi:NADH-quinone oxidoreductase subunit K
MPTTHYLVLSFLLFLIGTTGVLVRKNALIVLMGIELQINGGNLALLAFSRSITDPAKAGAGQVLAFLVIALAAAEAAVGLAILVGLFRSRQTINLDEATLMKR